MKNKNGCVKVRLKALKKLNKPDLNSFLYD